MTNLNTMYKGVVNSPSTYLREPLASGGNVIYVVEGSVFGTLPNLAVIGNDQTAETILINSLRPDTGYDVVRAVEGNAKDWNVGTEVARNFTNKDYDTLIFNINKLNADKVDAIEGKGLSTKDYTAAAEAKVDAIPENPKYTDTVYTHPASHPASMITESTTRRFVTDAEKTTWSGKQDTLTAGTNVSISGNSISATDTTYGLATASANGLMSSAMWTKLNGLYNMVYITESAYQALSTKDPNTLYIRPKA